jgi:hypothetical protein
MRGRHTESLIPLTSLGGTGEIMVGLVGTLGFEDAASEKSMDFNARPFFDADLTSVGFV